MKNEFGERRQGSLRRKLSYVPALLPGFVAVLLGVGSSFVGTYSRGSGGESIILAASAVVLALLVVFLWYLGGMRSKRAELAKLVAELEAAAGKQPMPGSEDERDRSRCLKATTAIGAVIEDRRSRQLAASLVLLGAILVYLFLTVYWGIQVGTLVIVILVGGIVLLNVGSISLNYRVANGLYGTNEYEAREIIRFVLENADDIDFSGGLGARDLDLCAEEKRAATEAWDGASS